MASQVSSAAKSQFYQELRGYLDKGSADLEPPVYWKRTHGKNHVTLWGYNYLTELGAFNDED
jgi:hypothetical protein